MKTQTLTLLPALVGLALALLTLPAPSPAQWGSTPDDPLPICTAGGDQVGQLIVRLGSGRYLVTWFDYRTPTVTAYYQLLTEKGEILLQDNGVLVFPGSTWGTAPYFLVSDGQGGCISVVRDYRNGAADIYGQRFDSLGNRLWGETGLLLILWPGTEAVNLRDVEIDGQGNVFLNWLRYIDPSGELYVQKVTIEGELPWGAYGMLDYNGGSFQDWQDLVPDYSGGAIDVWQMGQESDLLMTQHLDRTGNYYWPINGIPVMSPQGFQIGFSILQILPDGEGGGICVGTSYNYGMNYARIFRLNGQTGAVPWYKSWGSVNSTFVDALRHPADGTIYALRRISPSPYQFRLHRFYPNGFQPFGPDGIIVDNFTSGGSIVATSDGVIAVGRIQANLLMAQRFDSLGQVIWNPEGKLLAYSPTALEPSPKLCPDGADGCVAVWLDDRNWPGNGEDLFAAYIRSDGSLGNLLPPYPYAPIYTQREISVRGNVIQFTLTQPGEIHLELYDLLGRHVRTLTQGFFPAGQQSVKLEAGTLPSGVYWVKLTAVGEVQTLKVVLTK